MIFHHFVLLLLIGNLLELLYELMKAFQLRLYILLACSTFFVFAALLWILTDAERFADLIAWSRLFALHMGLSSSFISLVVATQFLKTKDSARMAISTVMSALLWLFGLALPTRFLNLNFPHCFLNFTQSFSVLLDDFHLFKFDHFVFVCFGCYLILLYSQLLLKLLDLLL